MGRRRNANPSSDESDDDRHHDDASASSPAASHGKGKKWTPGMSGKEQKARAKEQRFEQHRRKAERDRRNEQKRASREQREEEEAAAHHTDTTTPSKPVGRPGGGVARLDPSQIRRELKRLFGRIEHGGGVSPSSGRAVEVGDVVVVLLEAEIVAQRKSGAEAWSQRLNKRGEKELRLVEFFTLGDRGVGSPAAFSSSPGNGSSSWGGRAEASGGGVGGVGGIGEPPYHTVRRVVARWPGADDEILWDNLREDGDGASTSLGALGTSPGMDPRGWSGIDAMYQSAVDALSLIPRECWEKVMGSVDARDVCSLGATCVSLALLARSPAVRNDQHAKLFGRPPPPVDPALVRTRANLGPTPPAPPTPAALEELSAKRGWAATCASTVAADRWIPRATHLMDDSDSSSDDEDEDGGGDGDGEFEFDREDDDFAAAGGAADKLREMTMREITETAPRPAARYTNVGPKSAAFMLADAATAVSCDGDKIKLWFHGGDGQTEAGKRIATLPNPAGTQPHSWTSLASGGGVFAAGSEDGLITVWDVDALQVRVCDGHKLARHEGYYDAVGLNLCPASSLAVLPGGEYVAVGGNASGIVSLIGVTDETFHNQNISVDVDSYIEQMDQAQEPGTHHEPFGINSIVVHGVEKSYGSGSAAGWKLWVATSSLELVAIDPDRFECVERISHAANNCEWTFLYCPLASYGHILALDSSRSAITLFDTRCTSSARQEPIGVIFNRCEDSFEDSVVEHQRYIAMDDWSVWLGHEGCEGVRLYDVRMSVGPPRRPDRWLRAGDCKFYTQPVAEYGAGTHGGRNVKIGCFARGGDGVLVVAPSRQDAELDVRCSVYTGAHHGADDGGAVDDWEYERAKPKKKGTKKQVKKKYPKRQGGKFRARTAGG